MTDDELVSPAHRRRRRQRWRLLLVGGIVLLVVYYGLVLVSMRDSDSSKVPLDERQISHPKDRVTLQVEAVNLDPSTGSFDLRVRPVPHGRFVGELGGQLAEPLQLQVSSSGAPPSSFDFPAEQVVDPVSASVTTTTRARSFPFDRPTSAFGLEALDEQGGPVPIDVEMSDTTESWNLKARAQGQGDIVRIAVDARRELLAIGFALLLTAGILVVALITVAVIGGSIVRRQVDFDQVIWLGAMLVAVPAVRNEMPGVPPVGTGVDLFVYFPSVVIVALALLAGVVVLALNEAASNAVTPEGATAGADRE